VLARSSGAHATDQLLECAAQLLKAGLAQNLGDTRFQTFFGRGFFIIAGQQDNRQQGRIRLGAQLPTDIQATHIRQVQLQTQKIVAMLPECVQSRLAIGNILGLNLQITQHRLDELPI
jgi:hypothetical protein